MSQHVSGNMQQTMTTEHGPFVTIGNMRVRKSLIVAYSFAQIEWKEDSGMPKPPTMFGINIHLGHMWNTAFLESPEAVEEKIQQLDWIFKKEYHNE